MKVNIPSLATLLEAGQVMDRNGFTKAGRAWQKHGSRNPAKWGFPQGPPEVINQAGQQQLQQIITLTESEWIVRHHARFGNILEGRLLDGRGARWSADGQTFIGFIEVEA